MGYRGRMDWNDVRYFLALARLGSVRAAGKQLKVSHSTVARRVEALEAQVETRLFDRSHDGYVLTAAGRTMIEGAEAVERQMAELERGVVAHDERLAGVVTVTCGDPFVGRLILSALAGLSADHPAVELHFTIDPRPYDLARREADVAVRALERGASPPASLLGTLLAPVILGSYVADRHADRLDPDGLSADGSRWLGYDDPRRMAHLIEGSSHPNLPCWGSFSSLEAMADAVGAGLGIGMLPVYAGDADPRLRRLARPDLRHLGDLWLLSHPDLRHTARIRAARVAVADAFRHASPTFAGQRSNSAPTGPDFAPDGGHGPRVASAPAR